MIPARAIWRLLVLPIYLLIAGAVFALALRNTAGSILSPLAGLAPWVMVLAAALAVIAILGGLVRWRRRLNAIRRGRAAVEAEVEAVPGSRWPDDGIPQRHV